MTLQISKNANHKPLEFSSGQRKLSYSMERTETKVWKHEIA